ncbi:DNA/RNA-binding protein KIN17 [Holothuria leucospilota]|uniref:DNA/RNA-binding protein KIN17 n=1 Tax=Holothuria leucospilota TaxID=206669 RepID=A0A9Q1HJC9_HOLLE|nr:DNA/RNA-binding protein KIN17 [Holothuria leucospilota]
MPKHGFLTPKAIANRIKAKGLQKLRWYCQMCQKQCRDENGFKCHLTSESHQRQLLLFAENEEEFLDAFSSGFLDDFMELLRRRFGTRRVHCNIVYNEYISDRDHTHMNSTKWETLTEFVKWLGREGYCTVDHTEKGWFITYIDRDPEAVRRQQESAKKKKMERDDEERIQKFIEKQVERGHSSSGLSNDPQYTELQRENDSQKITLSLAASSSSGSSTQATESNEKRDSVAVNPLKELSGSASSKKEHKKEHKKRKTALEEIMEEERKKKAKLETKKDNWLMEGIVVKVVTKRLGEKFFKKKGVVQELRDPYTAVVKMIDSGAKIKMDQIHVETVIPAIGRKLLFVNGRYCGSRGRLEALDEETGTLRVLVESGPNKGKVVEKVAYEDVSKLYIAPSDSER